MEGHVKAKLVKFNILKQEAEPFPLTNLLADVEG
jgi:hypothetical protein